MKKFPKLTIMKHNHRNQLNSQASQFTPFPLHTALVMPIHFTTYISTSSISSMTMEKEQKKYNKVD